MDEGHYRQIMWIQDGGVGEQRMVLGTVTHLADEMRHRDEADYEITEVYGLDQLGDLKQLRWEVRGGQEFDENDYAWPEVVVHFPDGHRDTATYRVDGRA